MTREERDKAIRILQWLHDNNFLFASTEEDVKYATKLAIQELEQEPKWIPMTTRPMTEEERKHYIEWSDVEGAMIFDCELPEDGQEVLVSSGDYVCLDTFCTDDGCYFEGVDIDDVEAWMSKPKPYKPQKVKDKK